MCGFDIWKPYFSDPKGVRIDVLETLGARKKQLVWLNRLVYVSLLGVLLMAPHIFPL